MLQCDAAAPAKASQQTAKAKAKSRSITNMALLILTLLCLAALNHIIAKEHAPEKVSLVGALRVARAAFGLFGNVARGFECRVSGDFHMLAKVEVFFLGSGHTATEQWSAG